MEPSAIKIDQILMQKLKDIVRGAVEASGTMRTVTESAVMTAASILGDEVPLDLYMKVTRILGVEEGSRRSKSERERSRSRSRSPGKSRFVPEPPSGEARRRADAKKRARKGELEQALFIHNIGRVESFVRRLTPSTMKVKKRAIVAIAVFLNAVLERILSDAKTRVLGSGRKQIKPSDVVV